MGKDYLDKGVKPWTPLGTAEQAFLLSCLRTDDPAPAGTLDWPTLTRRIRSDGLAPLLYRCFLDDPDRLPAGVFAQFKRDYYQNASVNHIRLEELKRIGTSLGEEDIRVLVLKGGALATTVYDDPALRFMGDLDVAVPPPQARPALARLQADGYTLHGAAGALDDVARLREKGWHLRLTRPVWGKRLDLEFHWPLRERVLVSQAATLDLNWLWATAIPLDEGTNLWQPSPAGMLLHLCLHIGLQHRFTDLGLRQYVDVDRLLRHYAARPGIWRAFVAAAQDARAAHVSYFCLALTRELLGTPLPAGVMEALRPPAWKRRLFARRLRPGDAVNRTRAFYARRRIWWRLVTLDRPTDLLAGPWRTLFPGRAYLASYYHTRNPARLALYAVWHPFHALGRAGKRRLGALLARGRRRIAQAR